MKILTLGILFVFLSLGSAFGHRLSIYPGDELVFMEVSGGVPASAEPWSTEILFHFPSGATVKVLKLGEKKRWVLVTDGEKKEAWVMKKYVEKVIPGPTPQATP